MQYIYLLLLQYGFHYGSNYLVKLYLARTRSSIYNSSALQSTYYYVGYYYRLIYYSKNLLQLSQSPISKPSFEFQLYIGNKYNKQLFIIISNNQSINYIIINNLQVYRMICKSLQDLDKIQQVQSSDTNMNVNVNININVSQCYSSISQISVQSNKDQSNMKIIKQVIQKNINLFAKQHMQVNSSQNVQANNFIVSVSHGEQQLKIIAKKISCGFINYIYQLSQNYVIKIQKQITDVTVHQIQLFQLANKVNAKVPKLLDHGQFNGKRYILMTKLGGDRLWKYWPVLSQQYKFKAIQQICLQLKKLHSIKMQKYSPRRPFLFDTMQQAVVWYNQQQINDVKKSHMFSILCQNTLQNLAYMQKFMETNSKILNDKRQQPVFVHNDLHFGNILYDIQNHQMTGIIDFDFSRQLVKNYQLWHIIQFLQKPEEYVEQQFWYLWKDFKITNQIKYFKACYPELFQTEALATKIRLYIMDELAFFLSSGRVPLFNEKVNLFYRSTWLEDLLSI